MSKATNSSRGRTKRQALSSRRRGTSFFDRLEEARLRRQVVLANKNVAGSSPHLVKSVGAQSERADSEIGTKGPAVEYLLRGQAEKSDNSIVVVNEDADNQKFAPQAETDAAFGQSWRLFFPGIALGFVLAIFLIGWASSPSDLISPAAEAQSLAATRPVPRTFTAALVQDTMIGESPVVTQQISVLTNFAPAKERPNPPNAEGWLISTNVMAPTQIVPATVELPPLIDVLQPARHAVAPTVLSITPPARPNSAELSTIATSVFPGLDIVLHIPNSARQKDADNLTIAANGAGFEFGSIRPAAFSISQTNVRYFHEDDQIAAQELASAVGARLRDFTDFQPLPEPGVIEVWLEGKGRTTIRREDSTERRGILRGLRAELRRVFRPAGG
ncbi:MAG: hypothetical protein ACR2OY_04260 [Boseongicola sp.]